MTELEELKQLARENGDEAYFGIDNLPEGWEEIEDGDWIQDGKYQYCDSVVSKNGKFFVISNSRSGSYHTDWYYSEPTIYEAVRKEEVITKVSWVAI